MHSCKKKQTKQNMSFILKWHVFIAIVCELYSNYHNTNADYKFTEHIFDSWSE